MMNRFIFLPPGTIMSVFDSKLWNGRDVGDNSQFWKPAEILKTYKTDNGEDVADVRFQHDGRTSKGHFIDGMKEV